MKTTENAVSQIASLMGKRSWKARVKKYGLKALQQRMRKIGQQAKGRPRLPDSEVTPSALYQRARRAKLKVRKT
jgi:hypothetical protein